MSAPLPPSGRRWHPLRTLRTAVLLTDAFGLCALVTARLVSALAAVGVFLVVLAASAASARWLSPGGRALRRGLSVVSLLVVGLMAALVVHRGPVPDIGLLLGTVVTGVLVAHALVLESRRDLVVGAFVGLAMTVQAAGLAPSPSVGLPLLGAWPAAMTALALAHRAKEREEVDLVAGPAGWGQPGQPGLEPGAGTGVGRWVGRRSTAAAVAVSVLVGGLLFLVLPRPQGVTARSRFAGGTGSAGSAVPGRDALAFSTGSLDLRSRGTLATTPVMTVPADSPALWRGAILMAYDGTAWSGSRPQLTDLGPGPTVEVPPSGLDELPKQWPTRTDEVTLGQAFSGLVVAPGHPVRLTVGARAFVGAQGSVFVDPASGPTPGSYTVTSVPVPIDGPTLTAATGADPADPAWLDLPSRLPARVVALAASLSRPNRYADVRAIEDYLQTHEVYRLDSPVPGAGRDAVDDFLFRAHSGFCEQFASAETVMLRAQGIPARLVTGFGPGTLQPDGRRLVRVSDAHAWVEVWYPGVGWSASDPTAGSTLAPPDRGLVATLRALAAQVVGSPAARLRVAAGMLVVAALAAAAVATGSRLGSRRRLPVATARVDPLPPLLASFDRLEAAFARSGLPREASQSIGEYAWRLPRDPDLAAALGVVERAVYADRAPSPEESLAAVAAMDAHAAEALAGAQAGASVPVAPGASRSR